MLNGVPGISGEVCAVGSGEEHAKRSGEELEHEGCDCDGEGDESVPAFYPKSLSLKCHT